MTTGQMLIIEHINNIQNNFIKQIGFKAKWRKTH